MRTVWKQALAITDEQRFLLNADSKPLCAAEQHGQLCMWYETDPDAQGREVVHVRLVGTGHYHQDLSGWFYLSTVLMYGGTIVWHVYWRT